MFWWVVSIAVAVVAVSWALWGVRSVWMGVTLRGKPKAVLMGEPAEEVVELRGTPQPRVVPRSRELTVQHVDGGTYAVNFGRYTVDVETDPGEARPESLMLGDLVVGALGVITAESSRTVVPGNVSPKVSCRYTVEEPAETPAQVQIVVELPEPLDGRDVAQIRRNFEDATASSLGDWLKRAEIGVTVAPVHEPTAD